MARYKTEPDSNIPLPKPELKQTPKLTAADYRNALVLVVSGQVYSSPGGRTANSVEQLNFIWKAEGSPDEDISDIPLPKGPPAPNLPGIEIIKLQQTIREKNDEIVRLNGIIDDLKRELKSE